MTDQQRFDQLGFTSGGYFDTPNLDALAAGGVVFDAAYSGDTVCVPARNALLTGMLPHRLPTQENGFALREGCWTIARALRDAGYQTALVGKMHFAPVHASHGFDTMRMCEHLHVQELGPISAGATTRRRLPRWLVGNGYEDWRFVDGKPVQSSPGAYRFPYAADAHPTNWIEREARRWCSMRAILADRCCSSFPSLIRTRRTTLLRRTPRCTRPRTHGSRLPAPKRTRHCRWCSSSPPRCRASERVSPTSFSYARSRRSSARLVKQIDDAVGRLLDALDFTQTVVFFTTDHGDYAGNRGLLRKMPTFPFDDLARVPFFVSGASVAGRHRVDQVVQSYDFALTCLDLAGVTPPRTPCSTRRACDRSCKTAPRCDPRATGFQRNVIAHGDGPAGRLYKLIRHVSRNEEVLFDLADRSRRNHRSRPQRRSTDRSRDDLDATLPRDARSSGRPRL